MPLPEREGDKEDFVYQLLFHFDKNEVRQAYVSMLHNMKQYIPQITDTTMKLADGVNDQEAMLLHMMLVLVTDETNGFTQYAMKQAKPQFRLAYFRAWFADFAKHFMGSLSKDKNLPDPRVIMSTVRSEYPRRRDNGTVFKDFFQEKRAGPRRDAPNTTSNTNNLPRGGSRSAGK